MIDQAGIHRKALSSNLEDRRDAASQLRESFATIPDKEAAWKDLVRLTGDDNSYVRVSVNHSLGKVSIFKATEAEDEEDFRQELENALVYFERSAAETTYFNPSKFCIPFYRSYYVLTCKKDSSEADVEKYLAEAKEASSGSKSKEELIEAVKNLSTALKEAQKLHEMDLDGVKSDLRAYMRYCNRAAELLDNTEEHAPGATKLVKRGVLIIGQRIEGSIAEIQEKAKDICQLTRNTPAEEFAQNE